MKVFILKKKKKAQVCYIVSPYDLGIVTWSWGSLKTKEIVVINNGDKIMMYIIPVSGQLIILLYFKIINYHSTKSGTRKFPDW